MAKLGNGLPVELQYKTDRKASTGELVIPENTPSGLYKLVLYAEDFAHNHTTLSLDIEIIGR